jgi:predicted nucleotide-binding protein
VSELNNPYNCSIPGTLFTGYDQSRRRMVRGLKGASSYAVLGGRRCGKTSFLLQLEKDLNPETGAPHGVLPRLLDMQAIVPRSPADFFGAVYAAVAADCGAPPGEIRDYQGFLARVDSALPHMEKKFGAGWKAVLLIDELESAMTRLPDSACLENFRNLLMVSRHREHFRAVVAGVFSPTEMSAQGSPLNNLDPEYLGVLSRKECSELIAAGFPGGLGETLDATLAELTGRHPYILQGVLGYLFDSGETTEASMRAAARRFVRDRDGTFRSWLATFRPEGCALFQEMLDGTLRDIPTNNALAILSYHGVIDESAESGPKIGGRMFRDWFRANYKLEKPAITAAPEPVRASSQAKGKQVFVVHGRNMLIRNALFTFLRALGLSPLEWTALVEATGNPSPHINEILKVGFKISNSAVVLLTPDDEARAREEFRQLDDPDYERTLSPQPRPNVLFEAGMAMAHFPDRTVLVQVGWSRPFSDIAGIHSIKMDNTLEKRRDLARRLKLAGCEIIDLDSSIEWQTAGNFALEVSRAGGTP